MWCGSNFKWGQRSRCHFKIIGLFCGKTSGANYHSEYFIYILKHVWRGSLNHSLASWLPSEESVAASFKGAGGNPKNTEFKSVWCLKTKLCVCLLISDVLFFYSMWSFLPPKSKFTGSFFCQTSDGENVPLWPVRLRREARGCSSRWGWSGPPSPSLRPDPAPARCGRSGRATCFPMNQCAPRLCGPERDESLTNKHWPHFIPFIYISLFPLMFRWFQTTSVVFIDMTHHDLHEF